MISLLVAHDQCRVIGYQNQMPWHIPEELAYFKKISMGKAIIMGRKTFESIGKPLPGRLNIVLTRSIPTDASKVEGIEYFSDLKQAIERGRTYAEEVLIIGGANLFEQAIHLADRMYITVIDRSYQGDTYFPSYDDGSWEIVSTSEKQFTTDGTSYTYYIFERKKECI